MQALEGRVRLDGQLVEREVVAGEVERLGELGAPRGDVCPGRP